MTKGSICAFLAALMFSTNDNFHGDQWEPPPLHSYWFPSAPSPPLSCSLQRCPRPITCLHLTLCSSQSSALPSSHFQPQRPSTHPEIHCRSSSQSGFIFTTPSRLSVPLMSSLLILSSLLAGSFISASLSFSRHCRLSTSFLDVSIFSDCVSVHYRIISSSHSGH